MAVAWWADASLCSQGLNALRIVHILAGAWQGSGIAEAVGNLAEAQVAVGAEVDVVTASGALSDAMVRAAAAGVRVHTGASGDTLVFRREASVAMAGADAAHVHGCWTPFVWIGCRLATQQGVCLVRSPHGSLLAAALAKSPIRKRLAGLLFERPAFRRTRLLHGTSNAEVDSFRAFGLDNAAVMVPHGADSSVFRAVPDAGAEEFLSRFPECRGRRILLFMGRVCREKGIDLLAEAWTRLAGLNRAWQLVLAGPADDPFRNAMARAFSAAGVAGSVTFCGLLDVTLRVSALHAADLCVLPSRHENFGLFVAEALYLGKAVIATWETPWQELGPRGAGWSVPAQRAAIEAALAEGMALPATALTRMGEKGRAWASAAFTWKGAATALMDAYTR